MAITLTPAFLAELKKNANAPNVILEFALDSGTLKLGQGAGGFTDVASCLTKVSSLQNKIDTKTGYTTRGQLTCTIVGRDNFKNLVRDEYLKNRRVTRKDGFVVSGFAYSDYAATFTGKIIDWSRKGDELTLTIGDEMMIETSKKLPVEVTAKTQYLNYQNMHPADIMTDILLTRLGVGGGYVDSAKFASERDTWLQGWKFDRIITEPKEANDYINELQIETNSFIIHDGEKVTFKVMAPPVPGQSIEEWTDANHIMKDSVSVKSGYKDAFYNRIVVYYDYDESAKDKEENYDSAVIAIDSASQGASQWAETSTKTIKSKWIRSFTYGQPSLVTGAVLYHVSSANGAGTGYLTYNNTNKTLQWTPPGGTIGQAQVVTKDGRYQLFGADPTKYCRVIVTIASLPGSNKVDAIAITALNGATLAATLAQKILNRHRNPIASISLNVDINNAAYGGVFIKPTDLKDITTDEAFEHGINAWSKERVMLTSVRPDISTGKVSIEAVETKFYRRYGFIAPAGQPNYGSASAAQREYAYIGDGSNKVNGGTEDGYSLW